MIRTAFPIVLACLIAASAACGGDGMSDDDARVTPIVLTKASGTEREVALLFEVRASDTSAGSVSKILTALDEAGVRASFAITGRWAEANVDLTRAIAADGHQIINAGYDGTSFTGESTGQRSLPLEERSLQLSRTETTVYRITNRTTQPYFRPPLGDLDPSVTRDAAELGYPVTIAGSLDARQAVDVRALLVRVDKVSPGDVMLLSVSARSPAADGLPDVIARLDEGGYAVVTIDELLKP